MLKMANYFQRRNFMEMLVENLKRRCACKWQVLNGLKARSAAARCTRIQREEEAQLVSFAAVALPTTSRWCLVVRTANSDFDEDRLPLASKVSLDSDEEEQAAPK